MKDAARLSELGATDDWQGRGACADADPDLFFHPYGERDPSRSRRDSAAVAVCRSCPVVDQCLRYARSTQQPYGVWGGETEDERWARTARRGA